MKKLILLFIFILVCWTSYYDVTTGTLPKLNEPATALAESTSDQPAKTSPSKKVKIAPGDTVLSIVERLNPIMDESIKKVLDDFKKLNPKTDPNNIQIGKEYLFPVY